LGTLRRKKEEGRRKKEEKRSEVNSKGRDTAVPCPYGDLLIA